MASPRNHVADANPDLSRKRQRLSNEPSSSGSAPGSPLILDLSLESDNPDNIITIENMSDLDGNEVPYSAGFACFNSSHSPIAQLAELARLVQVDAYFEPFVVEQLSSWLKRHLQDSQDHGREIWIQKYTHDDEFFGRLAIVLQSIFLRSDKLFDEEIIYDYRNLGRAVEVMVESAAKLSSRITCLLPFITSERLSRRDSAQIATGQQDILLLRHINLLSVLTSKDGPPSFNNYRTDLRLNTKSTSQFCKQELADNGLLTSLATVLRNLSSNHRKINNSWIFINGILQIVHDNATKFGDLFEVILEVVNKHLLPTICEKHPRALPDGFHEFIATVGARSLRMRAESLEFVDCAELFQKYVKAGDDAVLPESVGSDADTAALWRLCEEEEKTLPWLLEAAWYLRTQKAFIFSDIIDVRTSGIKLLNKFLVDTFNICHKLNRNIDHPVPQYASRFLRANEITKYIFSADSHASLLTHSNNVVSFLAATRSYTNQETDIIWQACTNNVEAEFVKASVSVLQSVSYHLMFDHLRYVISLYSLTPVSKLSIKVADLLHELFGRLHLRIKEEDVDERRLAPAKLAVDIFRHLNVGEEQPFTEQLRWACGSEISKATKMGSNDRFAIYQDCIPDIKEQNQRATSSTQLLLFFLRVGVDADENRQLLAMLPLIEVTEEIRHFVETELKSGSGFTRVNFIGLKDRIETAIFMLQISDRRDTESEDILYDCLFGDRAFNNFARNTAWAKLSEVAHAPSGPQAAKELLQRYLESHVVKMTPEYATAALVEQLAMRLKRLFTLNSLRISHHPLWKTLVRFATESTDPETMKCSVQAICNVLFSYPENFEPKAPIIQCQSDFVREYVDCLCRDFSTIEDAEIDRFCQVMNVLTAIHNDSKRTEQIFVNVQNPGALKLYANGDGDGDADGSDLLDFTMRIQTPRPEQNIVHVLADSSSTVADLAAALPEYTHTADSRVVIAGKLFNLQEHGPKRLTEIGVLHSVVPIISPRYTSDCDVNKILTCPGPVEQAILKQYDRLSGFIDGQDQVARSAYMLLTQLPPSDTIRKRLSSCTAVEIFPPKQTWRTQFSISVLRRHLHDLARMGVVDEQFLFSTIRLLLDFLLDTDRPVEEHNIHLVLDCLLAFLQEKPNASPMQTYFDQPNTLVSRFVTLLSRPRAELDHSMAHDRRAVDASLHEVLLQAVKIQPDVWDSFSSNGYSKKLFASLLLDDDENFSQYIAKVTTEFCKDDASPKDAPQFFWDILRSTLFQAMEHSTKSTSFFVAALEFLNLNSTLRSSEDEVRNLIDDLVTTIWAYRHTESIKCPFADCAIGGLLRLLRGAITILKGFKKPLELGELAPHLFSRLLFPAFEDSSATPLLNADSRSLAFDLIKSTSHLNINHRELLDLTNRAIRIPDRNYSASFPGHDEWIRVPQVSSGLTNLGMTCYMNSLLQQLFANLSFRKLIFTTPIVDHRRQSLLSTLQYLFTSMQNGVATAADTTELAKVLDVRIDAQEDVHGFYATFMNALEESMPDEQTKKALSGFFAGKFVSQIRGQCGHVSTQTEPFIDVSITVKNKPNLHDSLDEFVQGEPMQGANKYRCMTCDPENGGSLVDAMKRTCLEDVPDNLTFCLKRFTFEAMMGLEGKANDRFIFPTDIDMAVYQRDHLENPTEAYEPDNFELVGVIVHQGTLEFGHYWSYARLAGSESTPPAIWQRLEDSNANICANGVNEVLEDCSGGRLWANGNEKNDNAYVLFYQRSTAAKAQSSLIEPFDGDRTLTAKLPPRIATLSELSDRVHGSNVWRYQIEHIFASDFARFVNWLLEGYTDLCSEEGNMSNDEIVSETSVPTVIRIGPHDAVLSNLASAHLLHVILLDPEEGSEKLRAFIAGLNSALNVHPYLALPLLKEMSTHTWPFINIWRFAPSTARKMASDFVLHCLQLVKTHYRESYLTTLSEVVNAHIGLEKSELDSMSSHWADYFGFISKIAQIGLEETTMIINAGYMDQIFDIIYLPDMPPEIKRRRTPLLQMLRRKNVDLSPLFDLLYTTLSLYVDLDPKHCHSNDKNAVVADDTIHLQEQIWNSLLCSRLFEDESRWLLGFHGSRFCNSDVPWQEYSPGRLLGLLAKPRPNIQISHQVMNFLRSRFENETEIGALHGLFHIARHVASSLGDSPALRQIFIHITKALAQWEGIQLDVLPFYRDIAEFIPTAVTDAIGARDFIASFIGPRNDWKIRMAVLRFFKGFLLAGMADPLHVSFETRRVAIVRSLARNYMSAVRHAYHLEENRRDYEQMIHFLQACLTWFQSYNETARSLVEGLTQEVLRPLLTEIDEIDRVKGELRDFLLLMQEWETDSIVSSPNTKRVSGTDGLSEEADEAFSEEDFCDGD